MKPARFQRSWNIGFNMPLKNYTSQVPAKRSIDYIETQLVKHGARSVLKIYNDNQRVSGICFTLPVNGNEFPYKLPARIEACEVVLKSNLGPRTRPETRKKIPEQAERTAWKILSDWVEAQMAMVELGQVEITEIMLPYLYDHKHDQTLYEKIKENNFKNLLTYTG